jgi:glycosyltransferase involved in cell wall biosynthesis
MPLVSISYAQREAAPNENYVATVYHGIPVNLHRPIAKRSGGYFAFLGRICEEKRVDRAIAIARDTGIPLKIAAKVDKVDESYFRERIMPLLDQAGVEFVGEINEHAKTEFLGEALALLFPIDWPEPFGLVMIEAMACGTPVIAFPRGSVPEIVDDGITGHIVGNVEEAIRAVPHTLSLDRQLVRRRFEERFSSARMAQDYLEVYSSLLGSNVGAKPDRDHARLHTAPVHGTGNGNGKSSFLGSQSGSKPDRDQARLQATTVHRNGNGKHSQLD